VKDEKLQEAEEAKRAAEDARTAGPIVIPQESVEVREAHAMLIGRDIATRPEVWFVQHFGEE
jgi:hypothetical protein